MAKKRIEHSDLFEPKITKKLIDELDDLVKKGAETKDALIEIRDVLREINEIKTAEQFKQFTDESEKLNTVQKQLVKTEKELAKVQDKILKETIKQKKASESLSKTEKQRLKLIDDLNEANSTAIDENDVLKVQLQEQRKTNKELAKDKLGLISAYDKESARLNDLRKSYKALRIEEGKETKQTRELKQEIQELDETLKEIDADVGQFQRSVGDYTNSLKEAGAATGKGGLTTAFAFLAGAAVSAFGESRDEARRFNIFLEQVKNTATTVGFALVDFFSNKVLPTVTGFIKQVEATVLSLKIQANEALAFFGSDEAENALVSQREKLAALNQEIANNSAIIAQSQNPFEGIIDTIKESNEVLEKQLLLEDEIINRTIELTIEIEKLAGEQERAAAAAGDGTLSFAQQNEALEESLVIQKKRLGLERELAEEQQKAAVLAVRNDLIRRKVSDQVTDAEIKSLSFIKDRSLADKVSIESLQRVADANLTLLAIQEERLNFDREAGQVRREISRDIFEKELDFAIDAFDSIKTLREREIADETIGFNERFEKLAQLKNLSDSSFESQVELIKGITGQAVDLRELVKIEDERLLRQELITEAGVADDVVLQRILDAYRERRTITRDLVDAEQDLTTALDDQLKASDQLFNEIERTRREGQIAATEDAEKNRQLREADLIAQAKFETDLAEENSDERILIAEKLKNDLAAIERERVADVEAANKKIAEEDEKLKQERIDNAVEFANKVADALFDELDKRNEAVNEALNNEIESLQESIDRQIEANRAGGEEKLADDQAVLAKTKLERQRELEEQAKQERLIALSQQFVNSVAAHSKDDPDGAIALALAETFAAQGIAQLIAGFEKGGLVEGPEQFIRINEKGQEFVVDAQTTKAMGLDRKGSSMKDFHKQFKEINTPQHVFKNIDPGGLAISAADYSEIVKSQNKSAEAITKSIKQNATDGRVLLDDLGRVVTVMRKGGVSERVIYESDKDLF